MSIIESILPLWFYQAYIVALVVISVLGFAYDALEKRSSSSFFKKEGCALQKEARKPLKSSHVCSKRWRSTSRRLPSFQSVERQEGLLTFLCFGVL
ncbi:hypothetical protein B9Q02_06455 [Candidatus Marsarchaeota G1 archaeon BE_D]|uniref:Uncharacterized protein n=1 Tax=Candidatus Marsarchaeota G1 archaeon BE_D TaxID=1978156 RepID=A0A2R6AGB9_9ARCH|nr:MAG: hypothetical protein B9Q02_06455 [Candidatus Marsarchaeota G1 archaeon BE_D]